jgi:hypothetical protein
VLVGCSAGADAPQASAALTASPTFALYCYGQRLSGLTGNTNTQWDLINLNDEATITISRIIVYRWDGSIACQDLEPKVLGPHAVDHSNANRMAQLLCPDWLPEPTPGTHSLSFIAYWSLSGYPYGPWNPLTGVSSVTHTAPDQQIVPFSFECKPIWVK